MKYACIDCMRPNYPLSALCRVLGGSRSGYQQHMARQQRRQECPVEGSRISEEALLVHIHSIHAPSRGCYGYPRIWEQLRAQGVHVRPLMQPHGIRGRARRRHHRQRPRSARSAQQRLHSTLGYINPAEYERRWQARMRKWLWDDKTGGNTTLTRSSRVDPAN